MGAILRSDAAKPLPHPMMLRSGHPGERSMSLLPSSQSSLVMGSPFIKMIFSLLNCAADKGRVGMAEVDGAVISGAPF